MNLISSKPKRKGLVDSDWVDMAGLESVIMSKGEENLPLRDKCILYKLIREMRDQRRGRLGLPPVTWAGMGRAWDRAPSAPVKVKKLGKILKVRKIKPQERIKLKRRVPNDRVKMGRR